MHAFVICKETLYIENGSNYYENLEHWNLAAKYVEKMGSLLL